MAPQLTGSGGIETSSYSNAVTFNDQSNTISGISYVDGSLVISAGQPSSPPPSITQSGNVFQIMLTAGRHKTTPVADNFNSLSGGRNNEYAPQGDSGTPSQLNFFFEVTIQFQVDGSAASVNVYHRNPGRARRHHRQVRGDQDEGGGEGLYRVGRGQGGHGKGSRVTPMVRRRRA